MKKTDLLNLLDRVATEESQLLETSFLAPCVKGGHIRTRVSGLVYQFRPSPSEFEGWGIFSPTDAQTAIFMEDASLAQIETYLQPCLSARWLLVRRLQNQTWLAYPAHEGDIRQRWGKVKPVPIHLVENGAAFTTILAGWDGCSWWFQEMDYRADPQLPDYLREQFSDRVLPEALQLKHLTPELRVAYALATQAVDDFSPEKRDERKLREALAQGGGELKQFNDRADYWYVEWTTAEGDSHSSAISKADLTVISAGICLSERDRDFDLQSLVGVVEQANHVDFFP